MRELKFRCWNGETMISPDHIDRKGNAYWKEDSFPRMSNEVMQYIGLKDKKGIDIYEGDIICDEKYDEWSWRGVIKFSHGVFGAEWLAHMENKSMVGGWGQKHNLRKLDDDIIETKMIVGNIYANPELLKE